MKVVSMTNLEQKKEDNNVLRSVVVVVFAVVGNLRETKHC